MQLSCKKILVKKEHRKEEVSPGGVSNELVIYGEEINMNFGAQHLKFQVKGYHKKN